MINYQVFKKAGIPFEYQKRQKEITLKNGEVLVKLNLSTICGSDLHTIEGVRKEDTPCILGHEGVGTIVKTNNRSGFQVGDRVSWSIADSCGECVFCKQYHLPEKCLNLFKYGHANLTKGTGLNGCYASHLVIRKGTHMVKIDDELTNEMVVPANCALATMVNALEVVKNPIKTAVIQGGGLLGIYACALLKERGVEKIFCLEINKKRFELIENFGATPIDGNQADYLDEIKKQTQGIGVDAIFEVAGVKQLIPDGVNLLRIGGTYVLVGLVHPNSQLLITAEQIIRKCLTIKGIHNYSPKHLDQSIAFLKRNKDIFPFEKLVSPAYNLVQLTEAVEEAKKQNWARVSIKFS